MSLSMDMQGGEMSEGGVEKLVKVYLPTYKMKPDPDKK